MYVDSVAVAGQGAKVGEVAGEYSTAGFGYGDHEGIDSRALTRECPQGARSTGETLRHLFNDVAGLQEAVDICVVVLPASDRFGEHDGGNERRPQPIALEHCNQRNCILASPGEMADAA